MAKNKVYPLTSADSTQLWFRCWEPDNTNIKACILLIHGLGEHSGRYNEWAERFCHNNIAVCAADYRGHGLAKGKRGHASALEVLMDDIEASFSEASKLFPGIPVILYGHSLGGNLTLNFYLKRKPHINGLIITSPFLRQYHQPHEVLKYIAHGLSLVLPFITVNNRIKPEQLSHDNKYVTDHNHDHLLHNRISFKLFTEASVSGENIIKQAYRINHPLLLMHGSKDTVTSHKASLQFSRNTGPFFTVKIWEGLFHELHNEPSKDEVFSFIMNWINNTILKN